MRAQSTLKKYVLPLGVLIVLGLLSGCVLCSRTFFVFWLNKPPGSFGTYTVTQIGLALSVALGVSTWLIAFLPMCRSPLSWTTDEIYLAVTGILASLPLLVFVPFGRWGCQAAIFMFGGPCVIALAADTLASD